LSPGGAEAGIIHGNDSQLFGAEDGADEVTQANSSLFPIPLDGEYHCLGMDALDSGGYRWPWSMNAPYHIYIYVSHPATGTAAAGYPDGPTFNVQLLDDLAEQTENNSVVAPRTVM
jgi:hypothetical protein